MKNGFAVFLAVLVALGGSWLGFVVAPAIQLGRAKQTTVLNSTDTWPLQRTGEATLGLQVYRANGCAACHTEQVRQDGVKCDVVVTSLGNNRAALSQAFDEIYELIYKDNPNLAQILVKGRVTPNSQASLPVFQGITKEIADAVSDKITAAGGKTETHIVATGADISRGWGIRRSVAADYLYDYPVQLGSLRAGPDLANIGARDPDLNWQLVHLYAPQALVKGSVMPPFRFLFEVRKIAPGDAPSPDALKFPKDFAPPADCEVVPKPEAKQLAAYLLSLRQDAPLYEAQFTPVMTRP
jgi:cbb3-type cytochrome oxidase cytochrome c subunit